MTACLGVILDKASNTQTFFGGGEVENKNKIVSSSQNHHSNDIMSLNVNACGDRSKAVSGQVGKNPAVFIWDTTTGEKISRTALPKNARAVSAIAISPDGAYIATADESNDHVVNIFSTGDMGGVYQQKGGPDKIHDLTFAKNGDVKVWTAGIKHFMMHDSATGKGKKGLFGNNERTSFACVTADDQGNAFSGGANGQVYVWAGNTCK